MNTTSLPTQASVASWPSLNSPCQHSLRRLLSFWLRQFKANRIASWLRRARGSGTCLLNPRLKTWNGVVCPRSLLRPAGLWSTNGH